MDTQQPMTLEELEWALAFAWGEHLSAIGARYGMSRVPPSGGRAESDESFRLRLLAVLVPPEPDGVAHRWADAETRVRVLREARDTERVGPEWWERLIVGTAGVTLVAMGFIVSPVAGGAGAGLAFAGGLCIFAALR